MINKVFTVHGSVTGRLPPLVQNVPRHQTFCPCRDEADRARQIEATKIELATRRKIYDVLPANLKSLSHPLAFRVRSMQIRLFNLENRR